MAPKRASSAGGGSGDDRVRVVVRIRPPVRKDEKFGDGSESLQYDKERNLLFLLAQDEKEKDKQYVFDKVLFKDSVQYDAWESAGLPVVNSVLEGYTGCVMCYGQTGAGKSYTLANEKSGQEGIMIQAFKHIFETAAESRDLKYEVAICYQQVYLDGITDLLDPKAPVELREDPKQGVYVAGAKWDTVTTAQEAIKTLQKGNSNRATACTKMNADSSRSHAALIVRVTCTGGTRTLNGMLYLVDLAGCERVKKSGVEGAAFDEAKAINQSLTTLGRCIEVLASNKKEKPPFRESKLTRLLSNAIGGGAKTTLVICCAPTMTDATETVGSLDFGQQAMNVVVRAKVNASTDYGSLTASLMTQKDKKEKPIRELEVEVLRELAPQLDEVISLEMECKRAALDEEVLKESVDLYKSQVKEAKRAGEAAEEGDKAAMVELLNARSAAAQDLEKVLVSLSSDPEMKQIQEEHEKEKSDVMKRSAALQEELRAAEQKEQTMRHATDGKLDGIINTARNLGQTAAYCLQTGEAEEAAAFYMQAKDIFECLLGPEHPKTRAWQEDLFFLINAPAIQQLVRQAQRDLKDKPPALSKAHLDAGSGEPYPWWMKNLFEMGNHQTGSSEGSEGKPEGPEDNWWMQSLFVPLDDDSAEANQSNVWSDDRDNADYMQILFGTPRGDGANTARGGPAFTPRGTLVAISQANGNNGAALSLGKPLQKQSGIPEEQHIEDATVNMDYAKDWVQRIFETPRNHATGATDAAADVEASRSDAFQWLQNNFGFGGKAHKAGSLEDGENRPPPVLS